jgi:ABC-type sugar transport system permease subunit
VESLAYLAPALILLTIFSFYPLINTFIIAFLEGTMDGGCRRRNV